jgi:hypothetical protein
MGRVLCSSNGRQYREKDADRDSYSVASVRSHSAQPSVRVIDLPNQLVMLSSVMLASLV